MIHLLADGSIESERQCCCTRHLVLSLFSGTVIQHATSFASLDQEIHTASAWASISGSCT